jgi:dihydroorotate dehydrogenase (NAD+) catalytic subunit
MGGLSGPAIRPLAVGCVYRVHEALPEVPIIGMGGVRTGADVVEFMAAGASSSSVNSRSTRAHAEGSEKLTVPTATAEARGLRRAADLVGAAHRTGVGA